VRGGGLYACGYVITFVWLEIRMFADDIAAFVESPEFLGIQIIQTVIKFVLRFALESLINTIQAFAWPVVAAQFYPPWGLVALVAMFIIFPRFLKAPLERWIFDDEDRTRKAD
jgi:hypothetical protein